MCLVITFCFSLASGRRKKRDDDKRSLAATESELGSQVSVGNKASQTPVENTRPAGTTTIYHPIQDDLVFDVNVRRQQKSLY